MAPKRKLRPQYGPERLFTREEEEAHIRASLQRKNDRYRNSR